MKDEKSGVMGMEIMEFGRVVLAMLRVEIGVIISILMDGFEFNYILFLFQGLDFYLGMEG